MKEKSISRLDWQRYDKFMLKVNDKILVDYGIIAASSTERKTQGSLMLNINLLTH